LHSSIDGVVHPLDTSGGQPTYDFIPFDDVDDDLRETTREWGEAFTDDTHTDRIGALVASLWPEYAAREDVDGWCEALTAWLADEREADRDRERQQAVRDRRRADRRADGVDLADLETTDHFEDVIDAIDAIDVREVARTAAAEWDTAPGRDPTRFAPPWRETASGTSCFAGAEKYVDLGEGANGGNAAKLVAREEGIITNSGQSLTGADFFEAVDELRSRGYDVPEYEGSTNGETIEPGDDVEPVSVLPLAQLAALRPDERRRAARKRGLEWPSTDDLRDRLRDRIHDAVRDGEDVVIPAPTSSGKSFTVATEQWRDRGDVTDDSPVIHLHETREARDSAVEDTDDHGGEGAVIRGRSEACPVARGDYDPDDEGNENGRVVTIDGQPASAWLDTQCDEKGVPFSAAHAYLDEHNDQRAPLPCCPPVDDSPDAPRQLCPAVSQWQGVPRKENELVDYGRCSERVRLSGVFGKCGAKAGTTGKRCQNAAIDESGRCGNHGGEPVSRQCQNDAADGSGKCAIHGGERDSDVGETKPSHDVVHATHPFAHVPGLVRDSTVVVDEQPDFTVELGQDRIRRAIAAYLDEIGAPVSTFEAFVSLARLGDGAWRTDAGNEADALASALASSSPAREWYLTDPDAHTLAPAIARAIWYALRDDDGPDSNERYSATVPHEPPRLDAGAHDEAGWNREWVSVVVDEQNDVRRIRAAPDLSGARCVIGLDAHPTPSLWQLNTRPNIQVDPLLDTDERRLWRHFERGLSVIQVGDDTRPAGKDGKYAKRDRGREPFVRHLREHFGDEFATAITDSHSEAQLRSLLEQAGVDPEAIGTMHFGEERSRNDFAGESVGAVLGCIDAGDDYVLDALAELGLDASPETDVDDEGEEFRAYGREFVGTDDDTAAALVASVRETHVAQAAGRYARNADDPDDTGTVFVRTDAIPVGFADYRVAGVEHVAGEKQRAVAEAAREHPGATARDLREHATDRLPGDETVSKSHVSQTLAAFLERGVIQRRQGAGAYGGDTWHADGLGDADVAGDVDLGELRDRVLNLWDTLEYQYAIRDLGAASKTSSLGDGWDTPVTEPADGGDSTLHDAG
jgi:hypothetical protein